MFLKSVEHLECHKASKSVKGSQWELMCVSRVFQGCFKEVSRVFQGSFKDVSRKSQGRFKEVSRVFRGSFKGVSRNQGCFKEVSRVLQGRFKGVLRKFQESSEGILHKFQGYYQKVPRLSQKRLSVFPESFKDFSRNFYGVSKKFLRCVYDVSGKLHEYFLSV